MGNLVVQSQCTAKNGLNLTKSGTVYGNEQTISTGPMSDHSTGWFECFEDHGKRLGFKFDGNFSKKFDDRITRPDGGYDVSEVEHPAGLTLDVQHHHDFKITPSVTDAISYSISGDTETRPSNYTIRVWKRIA